MKIKTKDVSHSDSEANRETSATATDDPGGLLSPSHSFFKTAVASHSSHRLDAAAKILGLQQGGESNEEEEGRDRKGTDQDQAVAHGDDDDDDDDDSDSEEDDDQTASSAKAVASSEPPRFATLSSRERCLKHKV